MNSKVLRKNAVVSPSIVSGLRSTCLRTPLRHGRQSVLATDEHRCTRIIFLTLARATVSDLDRFNLATAVFLEPFQGVVVAVDQFNLLAYFRSFAGLRFGLGCVGECA